MPKTFLLIFLLRPHWAVRSPQRPRVACSPYSVYPSSREETPYTWENIDGPRKYRKAHDDLFDVYKNRWQCITRMKKQIYERNFTRRMRCCLPFPSTLRWIFGQASRQEQRPTWTGVSGPRLRAMIGRLDHGLSDTLYYERLWEICSKSLKCQIEIGVYIEIYIDIEHIFTLEVFPR